MRFIHGRPADLFDTDHVSTIPLPPVDPTVGLNQRIPLARDYYVRVDTVDYSVDPRVIGRLIDVTATPTEVTATCHGNVVARHSRSWAKRDIVTDPEHAAVAAQSLSTSPIGRDRPLIDREGHRASESFLAAVSSTASNDLESMSDTIAAVLQAIDADSKTWRLFLFPAEGGPPEPYQRLHQARGTVATYILARVTASAAHLGVDDVELHARVLHAAADEMVRLHLADSNETRLTG